MCVCELHAQGPQTGPAQTQPCHSCAVVILVILPAASHRSQKRWWMLATAGRRCCPLSCASVSCQPMLCCLLLAHGPCMHCHVAPFALCGNWIVAGPDPVLPLEQAAKQCSTRNASIAADIPLLVNAGCGAAGCPTMTRCRSQGCKPSCRVMPGGQPT